MAAPTWLVGVGGRQTTCVMVWETVSAMMTSTGTRLRRSPSRMPLLQLADVTTIPTFTAEATQTPSGTSFVIGTGPDPSSASSVSSASSLSTAPVSATGETLLDRGSLSLPIVSQSNAPVHGPQSLSAGAIVGIAVGGFVAVCLISLVAFAVRGYRTRADKHDAELQSAPSARESAESPPVSAGEYAKVHVLLPTAASGSFPLNPAGEYGAAPPTMRIEGEYDVAPSAIFRDYDVPSPMGQALYDSVHEPLD